MPPYKFNSPSKADGFNLDVIQLRIDKPLDESDWAAGYRADLWFGPDANTLGTQSVLATGASDFAIRQAYVALRAPVGTGLDFKMGVFDSIVGYESIEAGNDPNFTRSYGHSIEPQTHTGLLASYRFCDASAHRSAWQTRLDPPSTSVRSPRRLPTVQTRPSRTKTYMGSVALTAPESMGFLSGSTLYAGIVNGFSHRILGVDDNGFNIYGNEINYYVGVTVATPVTGLRFGAAFDYLNLSSEQVNGETCSVAGYASYQATEKLSFHARAEYLKDTTGDAGGPGVLLHNALADPTDPTSGIAGTDPDEIFALTGTVQYDLWKNVLSRLELRWDHSLTARDAFGGTNAGQPTRINAWVLAANIIYKF